MPHSEVLLICICNAWVAARAPLPPGSANKKVNIETWIYKWMHYLGELILVLNEIIQAIIFWTLISMRWIRKKHVRDFLDKHVVGKTENPQHSMSVLSIDSSCLEDQHSRYLLRALSSSGSFPSLQEACLQSSRMDKSQWPLLSQWPQDTRGQVGVTQ